jgi:hypothetical protein
MEWTSSFGREEKGEVCAEAGGREEAEGEEDIVEGGSVDQ